MHKVIKELVESFILLVLSILSLFYAKYSKPYDSWLGMTKKDRHIAKQGNQIRKDKTKRRAEGQWYDNVGFMGPKASSWKVYQNLSENTPWDTIISGLDKCHQKQNSIDLLWFQIDDDVTAE